MTDIPEGTLLRRVEAARKAVAALRHPLARANLAGSYVQTLLDEAGKLLASAEAHVESVRKARKERKERAI